MIENDLSTNILQYERPNTWISKRGTEFKSSEWLSYRGDDVYMYLFQETEHEFIFSMDSYVDGTMHGHIFCSGVSNGIRYVVSI